MIAQHPSGGGKQLSRTAQLLIALVLLFVATPFMEDLRYGQLIEVLLLTFVLISAVFAVRTSRRMLWIGGLLCCVTVGTRWSHHFFPHLIPGWVFHAAAILFLSFVVIQILGFILRAPQATSDVLCAAIAAYLILGLFWALNYVLVGQLSPDAFAFSTGPESARKMDRFNAFYFSFVVLSTVGFGDITPVSPVARMLTVMEAITGMFYVTVLVARLVAMHVPKVHPSSPDDSKNP